jgi:hypothetical protein
MFMAKDSFSPEKRNIITTPQLTVLKEDNSNIFNLQLEQVSFRGS